MLHTRVASLENDSQLSAESTARIKLRQFFYRFESFVYKSFYKSVDTTKKDWKLSNLKERLARDSRWSDGVRELDTLMAAYCGGFDSVKVGKIIQDLMDEYHLIAYAHPKTVPSTSAGAFSTLGTSISRSRILAVAPQSQEELAAVLTAANLTDEDTKTVKQLGPLYFKLKTELNVD